MVEKTKALNLSEQMTVAEAFYKSQFFKDIKDAAQALVKISYGAELGISPVSAMLGIYMTPNGKIELDSGLIAALIKGSGRYDYRVREMANDHVSIEFFEGSASLGVSVFTQGDAQKAGLANNTYNKYPRNMLFARAMTNGARWFCPDVFGGAVYYKGEIPEGEEPSSTPPSEGEYKYVPLGASIEEGEPTSHSTVVLDEPPTPSPTPAVSTTPLPEVERVVPQRPYEAKVAIQAIVARARKYGDQEARPPLRGVLAGYLNAICSNEANRHLFLLAVFPTSEGSTRKLTGGQILALTDWAGYEADETRRTYLPTQRTEWAKVEALHIIEQYQDEKLERELNGTTQAPSAS